MAEYGVQLPIMTIAITGGTIQIVGSFVAPAIEVSNQKLKQWHLQQWCKKEEKINQPVGSNIAKNMLHKAQGGMQAAKN